MNAINAFRESWTPTGESYSLKVITDWLKEHNKEFFYSDPVNEVAYNHTGICLYFTRCTISIQTSERICGVMFAETAIMREGTITDKILHETPEDVFDYLKQYVVVDNSDQC